MSVNSDRGDDAQAARDELVSMLMDHGTSRVPVPGNTRNGVRRSRNGILHIAKITDPVSDRH